MKKYHISASTPTTTELLVPCHTHKWDHILNTANYNLNSLDILYFSLGPVPVSLWLSQRELKSQTQRISSITSFYTLFSSLLLRWSVLAMSSSLVSENNPVLNPAGRLEVWKFRLYFTFQYLLLEVTIGKQVCLFFPLCFCHLQKQFISLST